MCLIPKIKQNPVAGPTSAPLPSAGDVQAAPADASGSANDALRARKRGRSGLRIDRSAAGGSGLNIPQ